MVVSLIPSAEEGLSRPEYLALFSPQTASVASEV